MAGVALLCRWPFVLFCTGKARPTKGVILDMDMAGVVFAANGPLAA